MAGNRISILVALEGSDEGLKHALSSAERSLGELSASAKAVGEKATAGLADVRAGVSAFGEQVSKAKTQLLAFLTIDRAAGKVQEIVQVADAWNQMTAQLKLATAEQREFTTAQQELFDIAQRIGVPIQETATLYGKLQQAVRMLGGEQKDALSLTGSISQALRISGASAAEAQSSLLQFGQALASGVLRGEEFNSVVENSPRLAQALADGLNVPIGRLRKLAEEGRLTADVVVQALMSQKDKLAAEYAQSPQTVSQSFQRFSNALGRLRGLCRSCVRPPHHRLAGARSMQTELVLEALEQALWARSGTEASSITAIGGVSTCRFVTPNAWPKRASCRQ